MLWQHTCMTFDSVTAVTVTVIVTATVTVTVYHISKPKLHHIQLHSYTLSEENVENEWGAVLGCNSVN